MAKILQLTGQQDCSYGDFIQNHEALHAELNAKILKSFHVIENEALPILVEVSRSIQNFADGAITHQPSREQIDVFDKATGFVAQVKDLIECYEYILLKDRLG